MNVLYLFVVAPKQFPTNRIIIVHWFSYSIVIIVWCGFVCFLQLYEHTMECNECSSKKKQKTQMKNVSYSVDNCRLLDLRPISIHFCLDYIFSFVLLQHNISKQMHIALASHCHPCAVTAYCIYRKVHKAKRFYYLLTVPSAYGAIQSDY